MRIANYNLLIAFCLSSIAGHARNNTLILNYCLDDRSSQSHSAIPTGSWYLFHSHTTGIRELSCFVIQERGLKIYKHKLRKGKCWPQYCCAFEKGELWGFEIPHFFYSAYVFKHSSKVVLIRKDRDTESDNGARETI